MKFNADGTVEQGPTSSDRTWKATGTYTYQKVSGSSSKASLYYTVTSTQNAWKEYVNGTLTLEFLSNGKVCINGSKTFVKGNDTQQYSINRTDTYAESSSGSSSGSGQETTTPTNSYAPASLNGHYIELSPNPLQVKYLSFKDGEILLLPVGVKGTYSYSKSSVNGNSATLSFDCEGSLYDASNIKLTFISADAVAIEGKIGTASYSTSGSKFCEGTLEISSTNTDGYPVSLEVGTVVKTSCTFNIFYDYENDDVDRIVFLTVTAPGKATVTNGDGSKQLSGTFSYVPGPDGTATLSFYGSDGREIHYPMQYSSTAANDGSFRSMVSTKIYYQGALQNKLSYGGGFTIEARP